MTIQSLTTSVQPSGNGVATAFAFSNKVFASTDLVVTLIDTFGNLYPFTNFQNAATGLSYIVNNVDVDQGCSVVFSAPVPLNWTVDIRSNTQQSTAAPWPQATSIKNQGQFFPELHEEAFDRATRLSQDLGRLTYTFGIHGPDIEATPWPSLPSAANRKGQALMFDAVQGLPTLGAPSAATFTGQQLAIVGTDSGVANAYVVTHTGPVAVTLTVGTLLRYTPLNTNTGAVTVNADGTGAQPAVRASGAACTGGEFSSTGPVLLSWNGAAWQIVATAGAQPGFERTAAESSVLLSGTITGITQAAAAVVTVNTVSVFNPYNPGQQVKVSGVVGMTQINGLTGTITAVGGASGAWTVTLNINSSAFTAYGSGGTIVLAPNISYGYAVGDVRRQGADPTGVASSAGAIATAILIASVAAANAQVAVPSGTYLIDSTVQMQSNVKVLGAGITSVLNCTLAANSTYLMTGVGISGFHLEGMRFTGVISNNVNTQTTLLLFLKNGCNNGRVTRCFFDSCYIATGVDSATNPFSYNLEFSNNQVSNCALNGITVNSIGYDFRVVENVLFNIGVHVNLAPPGCAIQVRGVTGSVVANNVIRDCNLGTGGGLNGVDGIDMECITELGTVPTNLVAVTGNTIRNVSGYMIRMTETQNCTVSGNVLSGSSLTGGGIVLGASHSLNAAASGNTITGNGILNVTNNPAILVGGDSAGAPFITNNVISGNNTQGCLYGFYVTYAVDNIFSGNIAIGHSIGIYNTAGGNDNVYMGNKTLNCTSNGIQIAAGTGNTVMNNESHGNGAYGIIDQGTSTVLANNNCYGNTTASYLLAGTTPKYDSTAILAQPVTTGWGTPTGAGIIANYPGATATLAQTSAVMAQLITELKTRGYLAT